MELCKQFWRNGRSLLVGECLCTGSVLKPSDFHAWMSKQVPPLPEKRLEAPKQVYVMTPERLQFGVQPVKEKKTR